MTTQLEKKYSDLGLTALFHNMLGVYERIPENLKKSEQCRSLRMAAVVNQFIKVSRERFEAEIDKLIQLKRKTATSIEQESKYLSVVTGQDPAILSKSQITNFNSTGYNTSYEGEHIPDESAIPAPKKIEKMTITIINSRRYTPTRSKFSMQKDRRSSTPGRIEREDFRISSVVRQRRLLDPLNESIQSQPQKYGVNLEESIINKESEKVTEIKNQEPLEIVRETTPAFFESGGISSEEDAAQILTKENQEKNEANDSIEVGTANQTTSAKSAEQIENKTTLEVSTANVPIANRTPATIRSSLEAVSQVANPPAKAANLTAYAGSFHKSNTPSSKYDPKLLNVLQLEERSHFMLGRYSARKANLNKIFDMLLEGNASIQKTRNAYYQAYQQSHPTVESMAHLDLETTKESTFNASSAVLDNTLEKNSLHDVTNCQSSDVVKEPAPKQDKGTHSTKTPFTNHSNLIGTHYRTRRSSVPEKESNSHLESTHCAAKERPSPLPVKLAYTNVDFEIENKPPSYYRVNTNNRTVSPVEYRYLDSINSRKFYGKRVYDTRTHVYDKDFRITEGKAVLRREEDKKTSEARNKDKSYFNPLNDRSSFDDHNLSSDIAAGRLNESNTIECGATIQHGNVEHKTLQPIEIKQLKNLAIQQQEEEPMFKVPKIKPSHFLPLNMLETGPKNQFCQGNYRRGSPFLVRPIGKLV